MTDETYVNLGKEDRAALKAISQPSDARGLIQLAGHLALLGLTGTVVFFAAGQPWLVPALVAHGIVLVFLFTPEHECIHRTAFRSRWINDWLARAIGFLLVLPARYFRAFHTAHHRYTQIEGRDPELPGKEFDNLTGYLWHVTGIPYWLTNGGKVLRHAAGKVVAPYLDGRYGREVVREARWHVALYILAAAGSVWLQIDVLLWYWILPALCGQPFLRLYLLAEHKMLPLSADMLRNSRTTRTNAFVRFLAWNMPYHIEHLSFPAVPFHALPQAHARIRERIDPNALSPGYLHFHHRYIRSPIGAR